MSKDRVSLYAQVTQRIVSELEQERLPWVQPWESANAAVGIPRNARTGRRYTGINVAQCDGLPADIMVADLAPPVEELVPIAHRVMDATGAVIRIGGDRAYYSMVDDHIQIPQQSAYPQQINWYRTVLHELGHWSGHRSRLDRLTGAPFGSEDYFREELCAELASAFLCAELGIVPTVRHADYIGAWIEVMRSDERAIFRAGRHASRAAEFILGCGNPREEDDHVVL